MFWLGTHRPHWLWNHDVVPTDIPLFISYHELRDRRQFEPVTRDWCLDSGGFSEIKKHGRWTISSQEYVADVRWIVDNVGGLAWAAPQDWMCEPGMLEKTGLKISQHQFNTTLNYIELREADASLPFIPVIQGWSIDDYFRHIELYGRLGVDLTKEPLVGIGSVCRRQHTNEIGAIVRAIAGEGIRLHGFGVKIQGLAKYRESLASADSFAWALTAWKQQIQMPGCTHTNCANCPVWAVEWRRRVIQRLEGD